MQVFVTGVYSSGKTYLAKKLAKETKELFISFDGIIDYNSEKDQFDWLMSRVPKKFVMDAIPFDSNFSWEKFITYQQDHNCKIICCYCPDKDTWIKRVMNKENTSIKNKLFTRIRIVFMTARLSPLRAVKLSIKTLLRFVSSSLYKGDKYSHAKSSNKNVHMSQEKIEGYLSDYREFVLERFPQILRMDNVKWFDSIANEYTTYEEAITRINIDRFK